MSDPILGQPPRKSDYLTLLEPAISPHLRIKAYIEDDRNQWVERLADIESSTGQPPHYTKAEMIQFCKDQIKRCEIELEWLENLILGDPELEQLENIHSSESFS